MTDYYYDDEIEAEQPPPPPARRVRFDPRRERGADYFDRAHRHSRLVRSLKYILPAISVIGVVGFFVFMQLAVRDPGSAAIIKLSGVDVNSRSLIMDKPNISGFEGTRHAYEVKAATAVQDLANSAVVTLKTISARIGIGGGETALVESLSGVLDSTTKIMTMKGGIKLTTTNGYTAELEEATIDFDKGHLITEKPVQITGAQGTIAANAMEIIDRGAHIVFRNGVKVKIIQDDTDKPAPTAVTPAAKAPAEAAAKTAAGGGDT